MYVKVSYTQLKLSYAHVFFDEWINVSSLVYRLQCVVVFEAYVFVVCI